MVTTWEEDRLRNVFREAARRMHMDIISERLVVSTLRRANKGDRESINLVRSDTFDTWSDMTIVPADVSRYYLRRSLGRV